MQVTIVHCGDPTQRTAPAHKQKSQGCCVCAPRIGNGDWRKKRLSAWSEAAFWLARSRWHFKLLAALEFLPLLGILDSMPDLLRCRRHLDVTNAEFGQCIDDRVDRDTQSRRRAALATGAEAERVAGR